MIPALTIALTLAIPGKVELPLAPGSVAVSCPAYLERAVRENSPGALMVCASGTLRPFQANQRQQDHYTRAITAAGWKPDIGVANVLPYTRGCERLSLGAFPVDEPKDDQPMRDIVWALLLDSSGCAAQRAK